VPVLSQPKRPFEFSKMGRRLSLIDFERYEKARNQAINSKLIANI
jgi:hypothetical protein